MAQSTATVPFARSPGAKSISHAPGPDLPPDAVQRANRDRERSPYGLGPSIRTVEIAASFPRRGT
jgi:hypothetical protein